MRWRRRTQGCIGDILFNLMRARVTYQLASSSLAQISKYHISMVFFFFFLPDIRYDCALHAPPVLSDLNMSSLPRKIGHETGPRRSGWTFLLFLLFISQSFLFHFLVPAQTVLYVCMGKNRSTILIQFTYLTSATV